MFTGRRVKKGIIELAGRDKGAGGVVLDHEALEHPAMAQTARVRSGPHTQRDWKILETPEAGKQETIHRLRETCQLIKSYQLVRGGLVRIDAGLMLQMREDGLRPGGKEIRMIAPVPVRIGGSEPAVRPLHERIGEGEFPVGAPKQDGTVAGHIDILEGRHEQPGTVMRW